MKLISIHEQIEQRLQDIFAHVEGGRLPTVSPNRSEEWCAPDYLIELDIDRQTYTFALRYKDKLQPREVHGLAMELEQFCKNRNYLPMLISTFISEKTAEICRQYRISYLDLAGNCLIRFAHIHIEKTGHKNADGEKRTLRSLFSEKAARVLMVMLNEPVQAWQVVQLAERAGVSLGQVSNVRQRLLMQEYAIEKPEGIKNGRGIWVSQPGILLSDWQKTYQRRIEVKSGFYSLKTGKEQEAAIQKAFRRAKEERGKLVLSGFSAAKWIAPFATSSTETFYADEKGQEILKECLGLQAVEKGANVVIERPRDDFMFELTKQAEGSILCTNPVQTCLDLAASGERGVEAAEHIRDRVLYKLWEQTNDK